MTALDARHSLDDLLDRNSRFAAANDVAGLALMPSRKTMVLGCVDPRVDPSIVLGIELGEAAVIRNVGGRVTPAALRTLAMLALIARTNDVQPGEGWQLVVLHHTDCGIRDLAAYPDALAFEFDVPVDQLDLSTVTDPRASLETDLAALHANPMLPRGLVVSGLLYDTTTGRVDTVVAPAALGS
jgi:carbonic anhydrase